MYKIINKSLFRDQGQTTIPGGEVIKIITKLLVELSNSAKQSQKIWRAVCLYLTSQGDPVYF